MWCGNADDRVNLQVQRTPNTVVIIQFKYLNVFAVPELTLLNEILIYVHSFSNNKRCS